LSRKLKPQKTTSVDLRQVERLADLSRLSLGPGEAEKLRSELSSILGYFAALDKVEVPNSSPASERLQDGGLRDDIARPSTPDVILEGVPQKKGRYVRAPRVF